MVRNQDPTQDLSSPYYVHPSDGPHSVAIKPQLNTSNYQAWARAMRRGLGGKNKYQFVDGTIPPPTFDDLNFSAWERCNNLIHSWIMNSVSDNIAQSIVYIDNVSDVWNELKERFSKADRIRVWKLKTEINNLKQGTGSVNDYYTELRSLWEEFDSHRPTPSCVCPMRCACAAMRNVKEFRHEDQVIQFLSGLNENFSIVRTQILLMDPLPPLNKVYSLVAQEESHEGIDMVDDSKVLVNAVESKKPYAKGKGSNS
jgi:hypothetical protein